ncbi:MAG: hypothetical protein ABI406_13010 [Ktedonobacteraceae bacterium]
MTEMSGMTGAIHMTDLFFRIAERALGLAPTIQPMIAPLFAPASYADSEEMLDILATEEQDSRHSDTSIASTIRESNTQLEHGIQSFASSNTSKEASVAHQSGILPVTPVERHTTAYPEIHQSFAQTRISTSEQTGSAQPHQDTPVKNTHIAQAIDDSTHHVFPAIGRPENKQEERLSTSVPLTRDQPLPAILPPVSFTGQKAPRSTETVINRHHGPSHADVQESRDGLSRAKLTEQYRSEPLRESVQTTGAAPAVHVTIGRIEVRANPVPTLEARTQRRHAAPKTMSLDEYLKQSEKGGH